MSMGGRMWHWWCCVLPVATLLMWVAAIVFVILSWVSVMNATGEIWGLGPQWYIWNAVMFGILALYGGRKAGRHGMCGCKPGCDCRSGMCVCK
jgi:hypothetical protein